MFTDAATFAAVEDTPTFGFEDAGDPDDAGGLAETGLAELCAVFDEVAAAKSPDDI